MNPELKSDDPQSSGVDPNLSLDEKRESSTMSRGAVKAVMGEYDRALRENPPPRQQTPRTQMSMEEARQAARELLINRKEENTDPNITPPSSDSPSLNLSGEPEATPEEVPQEVVGGGGGGDGGEPPEGPETQTTKARENFEKVCNTILNAKVQGVWSSNDADAMYRKVASALADCPADLIANVVLVKESNLDQSGGASYELATKTLTITPGQDIGQVVERVLSGVKIAMAAKMEIKAEQPQILEQPIQKTEVIDHQTGLPEPTPVPEKDPKIEEVSGKNGITLRIGDLVAWREDGFSGQGRIVGFSYAPDAHIKANIDMSTDGGVSVNADELEIVPTTSESDQQPSQPVQSGTQQNPEDPLGLDNLTAEKFKSSPECIQYKSLVADIAGMEARHDNYRATDAKKWDDLVTECATNREATA